MLIELRVSNFALIDRLDLTVPAGFVSLTGETGAGKSLLIDAIGLLLGQRATASHIRTGAEEAELEALFSVPERSPVCARLRDADLLAPDDHELLIRRVLSRTGRGRNYVNGRLVSVHELQQLGGALVDIHGQHEQQSLLHPQAQLDALDRFGGLEAVRASYGAAFQAWTDATRRLAEARDEARVLREREELLRFQAQEIRDAAVTPNEETALTERCARLGHAERLRALAEDAYAMLYGGDGAVVETVGAVGRLVKELAAIDSGARPWSTTVEQAAVLLQEVAGELRHYRDGMEDDPEALAQCETRLAQLARLKKKYGGSLEAVLAKGAEVDAQLAALDGSREEESALVARVAAARDATSAQAAKLSKGRRDAAAKLEQALVKELAALNLGAARLTIAVEPVNDENGFSVSGQDLVQMLFSANRGEAPQPLARVASGGELSRVMLALKSILAADDRVPVLIFDEVDAGVGGATAKAIGVRLRKLARYHQVLCVTHLPQVAAQAQTQILVEKSVQGKRTVTTATRLTVEARPAAIAQMLGGQEVTPAMRSAAEELLAASERGSA